MRKERFETLKQVIYEKVLITGEWVVDLEAGTITTKRGTKKGTNSKGYVTGTVTLLNGTKFYYEVQEVIAIMGGLDVVGKVINHMDCDKTNNSIHNLEAITQRENLLHASRNGRDVGKRKLTKDQVREILILIKEGHTLTSIAKRYGVIQATIQSIKHKRIHKDVTI